MVNERLVLTSSQFLQILRHVLADRSEERCGLLAGQNGRVAQVLPVPNTLHSPVAYLMDGHEFIEAMAACEFEPLGIFHSHPAGPPIPSPTDMAQAMYPDSAYIIIALNQPLPSVRAFAIVDGQATEIEVKTLDG